MLNLQVKERFNDLHVLQEHIQHQPGLLYSLSRALVTFMQCPNIRRVCSMVNLHLNKGFNY